MEEKLSMEHRMTSVEDRSKSNTHRIEDLERRTDDTEKLVTSVALIAEKQKQMGCDIADMKTSLKKITDLPGKRWESIVEKIILLIVAAVVAYILAKIGL